ncbi:hypothetical protein [Blastococcus sp. SYSU DS0617]
MAKLLAVLLAVVVAVEIVVGLVVVGALFWLGSPETIGMAIGVLLIAALSCLLVARYIRAGRSTPPSTDLPRSRPA